MTGPADSNPGKQPYVHDRDFTLWLGDVRQVLAQLEPGSVDCVVTSPPYWGLRDYGTGQWAGGNPDCDHIAFKKEHTLESSSGLGYPADGGPRRIGTENSYHEAYTEKFRGVCGRCGATRQDQQLGLEPDPDAYVTNMVAVFRQIRRVLAPHGTCWVNLGDSYNAGTSSERINHTTKDPNDTRSKQFAERSSGRARMDVTGLKPKDLVGIPWRVAFALQADGWYLRSDIVWAKPNPMPESVTDRPTKAHEYVFLLTRQPRYWFDAEAVREPATYAGKTITLGEKSLSKGQANGANVAKSGNALKDSVVVAAGRNIRSVWEIATQPYPEAHFATYPEELVRRCLLAGCPEWVCRVCGKPRERIVEQISASADNDRDWQGVPEYQANRAMAQMPKKKGAVGTPSVTTLGWSDCGHGDYRPGLVLDPFLGSGTTALVARRHGRRCVGIELNPAYAALAARRLQQLSLLAEATL